MKKKNPKIMKHKGVTIYYDLHTGRFYAQDKLTGEFWEDTSVWGVQRKIDEPLWETCDMEVYAIESGVTTSDILKLHAKKINKRTNAPEFFVTESTDISDYDIGKVWGKGKYGFAGYIPINEHNTEIFNKLVQINREIKEKVNEKAALIKLTNKETTNDN